MDKPVYEDNRCEILIARYKEQAAHMRSLTEYDLKIFGGFLTLQLALVSWFAVHPLKVWVLKFGFVAIDVAFFLIAKTMLDSSKRRRSEIRDTILNINAAFGLDRPGIYLESKAINPPTPKPSSNWYTWGLIASVVGVAAVISGLAS